MPKIIEEKVVLNDKLVIEQALLQDEEHRNYTRLRIKRQDASGVLLFNTSTNKIILTRQFRYAIVDQMTEYLLEILAGKIDAGEEPLEAAIREAEEETGYRIKKENIGFLLSCFATPGYSSERFHLFYATVTPADHKSAGGGLHSEHESIELVELDLNEFKSMIKDGRIQDAKTIVAGLYVFAE